MIVEQYKKHKIKLVKKTYGFATITTYEVWKDNQLFCKALTIKQAKEKIDNSLIDNSLINNSLTESN
jgi:hypothetical protein